ncbi:hypothetical protein [Shewanella piezotolerans]|uniref:hypothetical protein n=1 Tax=Shewanella piezotolerans TaxID=404011 RepID=UPI001E643805|nr:hypothetical protein [Shewanella piezotolerans]
MQYTHKSVVLRVLSSCLIALFFSGCEPNSNKNTTPFKADPGLCDFQIGACTKSVGATDLALSISPWNTPSEKTLSLNLTSSQTLENVKVRIEGRDMFMGIIPVNLTEIGKNSYQAPLIYGSCSSGYMVWQAIVSFEVNGVEKFTIFEFLADSDKSH